jgi:thioredoxin 2
MMSMQIVCARCGTKNRVLEARLHDQPKCGNCGEQLAPAEPVALEGDAFTKYIAGTELPIVVDFWAEWCGPCKMMAPQFAQAAQERGDVRFVKLDTEASPEIAQRYAIRGIPTMILFRGGKEAARVSGAMAAAQLVRWLDTQLKATTA